MNIMTTKGMTLPTTLWGHAVGDGVDVRLTKESAWRPGTVVRLSPQRTVFVALVGGREVTEVKLPMNIRKYKVPATIEDVDKFLEG